MPESLFSFPNPSFSIPRPSSLDTLDDFRSNASEVILRSQNLSRVFTEEFGDPSDIPGAVQEVVNQIRNFDPLALEIDNRPDPQASFQWVAMLPYGFPPIYVEDANITFPQTDSLPFHVLNTKRYMPGFVDVEGISLTFYEDIFGTSLIYHLLWSELVRDSNGYYGDPFDYKRNIVVSLLDPSGKPTMNAKCIGIWPQGIGSIALGSDTDRVRIEVQYSTDDVQWGQDRAVNGKTAAPDSISQLRELVRSSGEIPTDFSFARSDVPTLTPYGGGKIELLAPFFNN